jgi:hypothetical protein
MAHKKKPISARKEYPTPDNLKFETGTTKKKN